MFPRFCQTAAESTHSLSRRQGQLSQQEQREIMVNILALFFLAKIFTTNKKEGLNFYQMRRNAKVCRDGTARDDCRLASRQLARVGGGSAHI